LAWIGFFGAGMEFVAPASWWQPTYWQFVVAVVLLRMVASIFRGSQVKQ
jgi:hypothetical protein